MLSRTKTDAVDAVLLAEFAVRRIHGKRRRRPARGLVSPVLSNIYLPYVLDLWFEKRFARSCAGNAYLIRYADDYVACFEHEADAREFLVAMTARLAPFDLKIEPDAERGVRLIAVDELDVHDAEALQARARRRILRAFSRRGLLEKNDRKEMQSWSHGGGFSLDATLCIEANDRHGLERLLRYCARPPFAAERIEELDRHRLIYHLPRPGSDGRTQLILSPLELIERIAALVPPPRQHRHRYYGVLAPNAPLRAAVTALASEGTAAQLSPCGQRSAEESAATLYRSRARYLGRRCCWLASTRCFP
jgi:hypothetical protein